MIIRSAAVVSALALSVLSAPVSAQTRSQDWSWSGTIDSGKTVDIRGLNGNIKVVPGTGRTVSVTADKTSRKSDVQTVRIEVIESANGVRICALYPTPENARKENSCDEGGSMNNSDNDVAVNFTVRLPAGADLKASTVNGSIEAEGLGGDVQASSVNGEVTVSTRGMVRASTVNGSIRAAMGSIPEGQDLKFSTVNGSIELEVPSDFGADVTFSSVSGEIESDFPITVEHSMPRQKMSGRIGAGGRKLAASTVNGDLVLKKRL